MINDCYESYETVGILVSAVKLMVVKTVIKTVVVAAAVAAAVAA